MTHTKLNNTIFKSTLFILFSFSLFKPLYSQCSGRYVNDIFTTIDVTTVQYGSNTDLDGNMVNLEMDIYTPQGDTASKRPVVIFGHGGSFLLGSKTDPDCVYFATELAKKGYTCASINYRLASSALQLASEENMVKIVFHAIQDGKAAMRYFRKDAATTNLYKVDADQIFIGGVSAGGILAINLTYVDSITDLPVQWQTWINNSGGLEGNSGNPGYCSRSNGTFGFAAGIGDTSWIDPDDVPFYGSHSTGDAIVLFNYGPPLNGLSPVNLFGTGLIDQRMNNINTYHFTDVYTGNIHPPYQNSLVIQENNKDSLASFLYNILNCNGNNFQKVDQKNCSTHPQPNAVNEHDLHGTTVFPNPFNEEILIRLENGDERARIRVLNTLGQVLIKQAISSKTHTLNTSSLITGTYLIEIISGERKQIQTIIKH